LTKPESRLESLTTLAAVVSKRLYGNCQLTATTLKYLTYNRTAVGDRP
jgi:hypothetical protein